MPKLEEIEDSIIEGFENEKLTYGIFVEKGIKLIEKIYILIYQYNTIINNTETLIDIIKKKINSINLKKEIFKKLDTDLNFDDFEKNETKNIKYLMKNIKNRLCNLDILLNNYVKNLKNYIFHKFLQIEELYKSDNIFDKENHKNHENEIKEIDKLICFYEKFNIKDVTNDLFEHIINISNIYILNTKNILCINIITRMGEILKEQNTIFKIIYKNLN